MRVHLKQEHDAGVSACVAGKRVWASGSNVFDLLADCERAFWRYKKHMEKKMRSIPSWDGFTVESGTFIPTGLAGQGAAYNRVPCVQVTLQPDGTYKAKLAHLDPLRSNKHLIDFMKRLNLVWRPVLSGRHLDYLEPICAVDFFDGSQGHKVVKVNRFVLPYRVSIDVLHHLLGKGRELHELIEVEE